MIGRVILIAVGLFAIVCLAGSSIGRERLVGWYDDKDGLGRPCSVDDVVVRVGPGDISYVVPACWTLRVVERSGTTVHQLRDPAPGLGDLSIVVVHRENTEQWTRYQLALKANRLRRSHHERVLSGWSIEHVSFTAQTISDPWHFDQWTLHDGAVGVTVHFRVGKVFRRSPKVRDTLTSVAKLVESIATQNERTAHESRSRNTSR